MDLRPIAATEDDRCRWRRCLQGHACDVPGGTPQRPSAPPAGAPHQSPPLRDPPRLHAPCAAGTGALKLRPPARAAAHPHAQTEGSWRRTGLELPRLAAWDASPGWRQDLGRQQARTTPGFGVVSRAPPWTTSSCSAMLLRTNKLDDAGELRSRRLWQSSELGAWKSVRPHVFSTCPCAGHSAM